jgi:hypothetical protein
MTEESVEEFIEEFIEAIKKYDNLDELKEIYKKNKKNIDIHYSNEYPFRNACYYGKIDFMKWLWELSNSIGSPINIHVENDDPFRLCCSNNNFKGALWLYNLSQKINSPIDLNAPNWIGKSAFVLSCERNHIEIAEWFCELSLKYHIITFNNKITHFEILSDNQIPNDYRKHKIDICENEEIVHI